MQTTGSEVIKLFHAQLNWAWKLKYRQMKEFLALSLSDVVFFMLINIKMPKNVGIVTFMSRLNFMLTWVEHRKSFITSGPGLQISVHNQKSIFLFLNQNICCGYSKELSRWEGSFEHPKHMLKLMGRKFFTILCSFFVFTHDDLYSTAKVFILFFFSGHHVVATVWSVSHVNLKVSQKSCYFVIWIFLYTTLFPNFYPVNP